MSCSKMSGGEGKCDIKRFLKQYKIVECSCCDELIGFQHRVTGAVICDPDCSSKDQDDGDEVDGAAHQTHHAKVDATKGKGNICIYTSPVRANIPEPVISPVQARIPEPLTSPVRARIPEPLTSPVRARIPEPVTSPVRARIPEPVTSTPIRANIREPVTSPVRASVPARAASPARGVPAPVASPVRTATPVKTSRGFRVEKAASKKLWPWQSTHFSPRLESGAEVKTTFVWGLSRYQIQAVEDENAILEFHDYLNTFAAKQPPMARKPRKDEVVIGIYCEEYYRGRVISVTETGCDLIFIDFGDQIFNEFEKIIELNDEIFKSPVMSLTVSLSGIPKDHPKIKVPAEFNNVVFDTLQLELVSGKPLIPNDDYDYEVKLWAASDTSINMMVRDLLKKASSA